MHPRIPVSLNVIRVAKPCPASWDAMHGDARVRFCDECKLNVYNLSALSRSQAETLVSQHEGRLCVRYFQRADGTVITQDCGGGIRRAMQRTKRLVTATAGAIFCAVLAPFGLGSSVPEKRAPEPKNQPVAVAGAVMFMGKPAPQPRDVKGELAVMGDLAIPAPQPQPIPLMGIVAPLPPATQPTTQPAGEPSTQPAK